MAQAIWPLWLAGLHVGPNCLHCWGWGLECSFLWTPRRPRSARASVPNAQQAHAACLHLPVGFLAGWALPLRQCICALCTIWGVLWDHELGLLWLVGCSAESRWALGIAPMASLIGAAGGLFFGTSGCSWTHSGPQNGMVVQTPTRACTGLAMIGTHPSVSGGCVPDGGCERYSLLSPM